MAKITNHVSIIIPRPRDVVFDCACDSETYKKHFVSYGPIAGIANSEILDGEPLQKGAIRRITTTDGQVLDEDILEYDRPNEHRYRFTGGLKPPFGWLVRAGEARWVFTDVEGGTRIDWSYAFELRSVLAYPFTLPIAALFRRWQLQSLNAIHRLLAEQSATNA